MLYLLSWLSFWLILAFILLKKTYDESYPGVETNVKRLFFICTFFFILRAISAIFYGTYDSWLGEFIA